MIDAGVLAVERRSFFLATNGGVLVLLTGAAFWTLLGGLGFVWSARTWCVVMLRVGAVALPLGVVFLLWLERRLAHRSALSSLVPPALLPVALWLGVALAAYRSDPSLVPLVLVVGFASHWPVVGWAFDTPILAVHAVVRAGTAVALWMLVPSARFTWMPISIGVVYALTALWVSYRVRRLRTSAPA